jgi:CRP/FNR family transcriptional regulator
MALFEGIRYPASAVFDSDGTILEIDFIKFKEYFLSDSKISMMLFKSLTKKIKILEDIISLNIVLDSTARLAKYICENDDALTIKHNQLAKYLHMTPETLSRTFKKFARLGFIQKKNCSYVIVDKEALAILYE